MKKLVILILTFFLILLSSCTSTSNIKTTTNSYKTISNEFNENLNTKEVYYRLFSKEIKHNITIEITNTELKKMVRDMKEYQAKYGNLKTDTYYKANFIYQDQYGTIKIENVGFRTKGNTSRVLPQNNDGSLNLSHYKIKFNETFNYKLESQEFKQLVNRKVFDLDELNLKFNRNNDTSYISEIFSYDLFNKIGVNAPLSTLASFTLKVGQKETLLGVYSIIEPIDKEFIDKRFEEDASTGNLYKCLWQNYGPATLITGYDKKAIGIKNTNYDYRPTYDLKTNNDSPDYSDLINFIYKINTLNGSAFESYIESNFEVDNFIKLLALGVLIGNPDDYRGLGNNYYLYHNEQTEKFEMIPYDYDHSLGQGWGGEPAFSNYSIGANIYNWPNNNAIWNQPAGNGSHPLADKLLNIKKYQLQYEQYLKDYIDPSLQIFNYDSFKNQYAIYKSLYNDDAKKSQQRLEFGERNSYRYFEDKIKDINNQLNYYKLNPSKRGVN